MVIITINTKSSHIPSIILRTLHELTPSVLSTTLFATTHFADGKNRGPRKFSDWPKVSQQGRCRWDLNSGFLALESISQGHYSITNLCLNPVRTTDPLQLEPYPNTGAQWVDRRRAIWANKWKRPPHISHPKHRNTERHVTIPTDTQQAPRQTHNTPKPRLCDPSKSPSPCPGPSSSTLSPAGPALKESAGLEWEGGASLAGSAQLVPPGP